jgi:hypothetical protein
MESSRLAIIIATLMRLRISTDILAPVTEYGHENTRIDDLSIHQGMQ